MVIRSLLHLVPGFLALKRKQALAGLLELLPNVSQEHREEIRRTMSEVRCRKEYDCCKSGLTQLCPMQVIGRCGLTECLAEDTAKCETLVCSGMGTSCRCPVRRCIAETFRM